MAGLEHIGQPPTDSAAEPPSKLDHEVSQHIPSQHMPSQSAVTMSSMSRRRRKSSSASGGGLRRSASTPNVRGMAGEGGGFLDKTKRNKLGYHRTSIACSHCRRRKIRCLLASDDTQQRCLNCIKLKKDCSFLPVDPQAQGERRPRTKSTVEVRSGETSGSSSSSPPLVGGHLINHVEDFNHFPPLPLSIQDYSHSPSGVSLSASSASPASRAPFGARNYEYFHHRDSAQWDVPYIENGPLSAGNSTPEDPSQSHWRSPLTPAFPNHFSGPPTSSSGRDSITSFAPLNESVGWPTPARTMSLHGGQDAYQNYQSNFPHSYESDIRRRASEMPHPSSIQASREFSNPPISEATVNQLPVPVANQPVQQHWGTSHASWNPPINTGLMKPPDFAGWYSPEPGVLPRVQEEEIPPPFGSPPAVIYSDGMHP